MIIKKHCCNLCAAKGIVFCSTRSGLRIHMKTEHRIIKGITNIKIGGGTHGTRSWKKQDWWQSEEMKP